MPVPSTRADENGHITINPEACCGCGICVSGCPDRSLLLEDGKAVVSSQSIFGCFACGYCMSVCPCCAIQVSGRGLSPADIFPLPSREAGADYTQLLSLMQRRRSVREFTDKAVSEEHIAAIIQAVETAPMGIPPSEVRLMILDNQEKVGRFSRDICAAMERGRWMTSPWFLSLMRPFWGKENDASFRRFIKPMLDTYIESRRQGRDLILYDAPLAMYFYGSPYSDADQMIAATYAMLAGEALGLGTCMIGAVHPFLQFGKAGALLRKKYGVQYKSKTGLVVIFGYPVASRRCGVRRALADVHRIGSTDQEIR